jgi:sigma-B regulation protein RsbU (phosphoserine phosphatase)
MEFRARTNPDEVLNRVNRLLCEKSLPYQFVTLFLFVLGPDGTGQFINAGHNPAYLFRASTGRLEVLTSDLFAVGMFPSATYQPTDFQLLKDDILLVYSDGLTDAENQHQEMFGEKRLRALIRQQALSGSCSLERKLLTEIESFTQGVPQTDDITFAIIEKFQ